MYGLQLQYYLQHFENILYKYLFFIVGCQGLEPWAYGLRVLFLRNKTHRDTLKYPLINKITHL